MSSAVVAVNKELNNTSGNHHDGVRSEYYDNKKASHHQSSSSLSRTNWDHHHHHHHHQANSTLVTAFFPLDGSTRHTPEEYHEYMTNLFSNDDAMIIFTSQEFEPTIRAMRQNNNNKPDRTLIVPMNLTETRSWQMFSYDFWYFDVFRPSRKIRSLGSNKGIVDHLPYVVWNSKVEFLKLGSDKNPFRSDFFAWMDVGLVRWEEYTNTTLLQRVPPELSKNKLLIMDVTPILSHKKYKQMSAGMFGGYKPAIDQYYDKYYQVMEDAGNSKDAPLLSTEQFLLHRTCLQSPGLCHIIVPMKSNRLGPAALKFPCFYMLALFNAIQYKMMMMTEELNNSDGVRMINPCNGMDDVTLLEECAATAAGNKR